MGVDWGISRGSCILIAKFSPATLSQGNRKKTNIKSIGVYPLHLERYNASQKKKS